MWGRGGTEGEWEEVERGGGWERGRAGSEDESGVHSGYLASCGRECA